MRIKEIIIIINNNHNSGDFGAFLGCGVFLTFFLALVAVFFPLLDIDAFLGLCSSWLGSSLSPGDTFLGSSLDNFSVFLVCEILLVTHFVKVNNFNFISMIFLISMQALFMSLFLFFVKVSVLFHLLVAELNLFPFLRYDCTCLMDRNTLQLFFGLSNVFAKQIVCCLL